MMKPKCRGKIKLHIYPAVIIFSLGETDDEFLPWLRKQSSEFKDIETDRFCCGPFTRGKCTTTPSGDIVIRCKYMPDTPRRRNTLAHEIFHAATMVLGKIGMSVTWESDEAYAYLIGYMTEQIEHHLYTSKV